MQNSSKKTPIVIRVLVLISLASASLMLSSSASHFIVHSRNTQLWKENKEDQQIDMFDCWRKGTMNSSKDGHLIFWQDVMVSELYTNLLTQRNNPKEMLIIDNDYIAKRIISFSPSDICTMRH